MVVVDTNIIIEHLRQGGSKNTILQKLAKQKHNSTIAMSVISIQELYEGKSTLVEKKESYMLATIAPIKVLSYSYQIAELAGKIARNLKTPIQLADTAIAATTIINNGSLLTLNKKHFKDIPNLKLYNLNKP